VTPTLAAAIEWRAPQMLGVALLVGVLIVLAVALLYPSQVRLLPPAWRWTLPGLRCAGLLALALSVARPVAQRNLAEDERGAVVVLVDHSKSMDVTDAQRSPALRVALADGLGRLPPDRRSRGEALAPIQRDVDRLADLVNTIIQAQRELSVAQLQGKENPSAQARLDESAAAFATLARSLAAARKKLTASAPMAEALAGFERIPPLRSRAGEGRVAQWAASAESVIAEVSRKAAQFQTDSDEELYRNDAEVRAACDELKELTRFELVQQALTRADAGLLSHLPPRAPVFGYAIGPDVVPLPLRGAGGQNVKRLILAPDGDRSDLTGGLREVTELLRHQPIQSVVLFSDGRQVGAETSFASSLLGGAVPVFAISPAPPAKEAPVRDVALARLTMPQSMFVGESLNVSAELRWTGLDGKSTQVTLESGAARQTKIARAGDKSPLQFSLKMNDAGPQRVTLTIAPVEGEISVDNNRVTRWVKVLSDRFDVLLVSGSPSWDFRYLRNALTRTPWIRSQSVLLDQPSPRLGASAGEILTQDVVILCDVQPKALSSEQWEALRKMVARRGGSVILMAGQAHLPQEYTGEFLSEFLPYRRAARRAGAGPVWRTWPGEEPEFRIVPAPRAPVGDVLPLDDNAAVSAERWIALPPVFRYLAIPELKEVAQPLLVERGSGAPVLTRHRLGRGKVFFLGLDETWRWRNRVGERDQDRFFQQLVRTAADEPYAATNESLSLDADHITVAPGEPVHVRARLTDPSAAPPGWPGLDVDLLAPDDQIVRTVRMAPVGEPDSGRFEATVAGPAEADEYRLRVRGPDGAELQYPLHVARSYEAEMANLSPDENVLRRLAQSSGGEFLTLEQLKTLPQRLAARHDREPTSTELRLWSSWYLYAFVLACLGAEWSLRKRFGLA
jgi:hypothetical protein